KQFIYQSQHLIPGPCAKCPPFQFLCSHSPRIPSKEFSELHDTALLPVECYTQIKMFFHSSGYLVNVGTERFCASLQILLSPTEDPRIAESASCDSRTAASRII